MNNSKVIGIIMTYNCAHLVEGIYRRLPLDVFDEVIIADDGSADNIEEVAHKIGLPYFSHEHGGYGTNIKYGLQKALERGAEYMVEIHGDGQYDPDFIPAGLQKIQQGYAFLMGSRFVNILQPLRDKMSLIRYMGNICLSFMDRLVLRLPLTEFHSGFRIYSRQLIEKLSTAGTSADYLYSFEIIAQAKYCNLPVTEIPIRCDYSQDHTSIGLRKSFIYAWQTRKVLAKYILARMGFKIKIFNCR
ncbi:MAG: glycosyltransferase family 2 protein [Candidatus Doudnabacteria bacterium]|nr:glycosyltransferase family 2 protein [Candidatus Doudnabacteria bacterium]